MKRLGALGVAALVLAAALGLSGLALRAAGHDPGAALAALASGAFGDARRLAVTLERTTPLVLCGLAVAIAFRAGLWNIGAEGQLVAGSIAAAWAGGGAVAGQGWGAPVLVLAAGALGGALWGMVPGLLRAWRGVPEVIVTILLNFVALEAVSWLVQGPMREEAGRYPQSDPIAAAAALPTWGRVPAALLLALALALLLQLWLGRTRAGLTVRVAGASPRAARVAGMPVRALTAWVFVLSGALAGLGGAAEMQGPVQRLYEGYAPGYGFSAIAVALLARLEPLLVAPAALLFGALAAGSERMEALAGVPAVVGQVVQALVVLGSVLAWRREEP